CDLADDLDRFLNREPIRARPTPAWERAWKWARRHPGTAGLATGLVGLFVLAFALVTSLWLRAEALQAQREREHERAMHIARAEAEARAEAKRLSARRVMQRGVGLCENGDLGAGLLWLVHSLETLPAGEKDLDRSLRLLLDGWGRQLHALDGHHVFPGEIRGVL